MNIEKKGILNKTEYLGPVWPADVWPANDIPCCSIFTYFQYSFIHDELALSVRESGFSQTSSSLSSLLFHISFLSKEMCLLADLSLTHNTNVIGG